MKILLKLILTYCCFHVTNSMAFDTKMHVWVGQEVLNDLIPDGSLEIKPFGSFPIDSDIYNAIKNNQRIYLSGNLGPDTFPDVVGGQMTTHPGIENGMKTDDWLEWVLSNALSDKEIAFAYGYLAHAAADTFAHTYVNWYAGDVFDLSDGEVSVEVRHTLLEKYLSKHLPPMSSGMPHDVVATGNELPIPFIRDKLFLNDIVEREYSLAGAKHLSAMYRLEGKLQSLENKLDSIPGITDLNIGSLAYELAQMQNQLMLLPFKVLEKYEEELCSKKKKWKKVLIGLSFSWVITCKIVEKTVEVANPVRKKVEQNIDHLKADKELIESYNGTLSGIVKAWNMGVKEANNEYIITSSKIGQALMNPSGGASEAFKEWWDCYSAVYLGVPVLATRATCTAKNFYNKLLYKIENINFAETALLFGPTAATILEIERKIDEEIERALFDVVESIAKDIIGEDIIKYYEIWDDPINDETLRSAYLSDDGNKGLLLIEDITTRLKSDMNLDSNGKFDKNKFNVAYNAVVTAKLSLLSQDNLNDLMRRAGVESSGKFAGVEVFSTSENILFDAIKSIDGNHQWFEVAPPYPRKPGFVDIGWPGNRNFGYSSSDGIHGLRIWADFNARDRVFKKIFKGPLSPGLEAPNSVGLSVLNSVTEHYQPCYSNPFPNNAVGDKTCIAIWLIPVMSNILLN